MRGAPAQNCGMANLQSHFGKLSAASRKRLKQLSFSWKSAEQQAAAIRKVGLAKNPQDIPLLIDCLDGSYHVTVRAEAARALGAMKCESATPRLIAMLEDDAQIVQNAAATALGEVGDQRAVTSLVSLFKHPTEAVRHAAADAAVKLGPEAIGWIGELLKKSSFEIRMVAASALGQIRHERAFLALEMALGDTDSMVRREVAFAIANQGRQAGERLCAHLGSENPLVRQTTAAALQKMRAPQSVEPLVNQLRLETEPEVRDAIWKALAACRWEPAVRRGVAKDAIDAGNWERAEKTGADAVNPFIELFRSGDMESKKIAEASLLRIGLAGHEPLNQALSDRHQSVRRLIVRVLTQLNWIPATQIDDLRFKIASGNYMEARYADAIPLLSHLLSDQNEIEREAVTETLGCIGDPAAVEALGRAALDHAARVRTRTAIALASFGTERSRQILEVLAQDTDYNVASAARASLRHVQSGSEKSAESQSNQLMDL